VRWAVKASWKDGWEQHDVGLRDFEDTLSFLEGLLRGMDARNRLEAS
jgi:hypothetical protein